MHSTNLRKVGGSIMMSVPPVLLEMLRIGAGSTVGLAVENGRLIVDPQPRPRFTLEELLAQCDASASLTDEDRSWIDDGPRGTEQI